MRTVSNYYPDVVRRCRVCGCRSDEVKFVIMKDSKTGRFYMHNICRPCRIEENAQSRDRRKERDPKHDSRTTMEWRRRNIDKWRNYHREYCRRKRTENRMRYAIEYHAC